MAGGISRIRPRGELFRLLAPASGLGIAFLLFAAVGPASFHGFYNLKTILTQSVIVGVGALGMTLVIVSGGIDLSVGAVIALGTVLMARILNLDARLPFSTCTAVVVMGALCGFANGFLSTRLRIAPFIVTLGTMQIFRGAAKWLAREQTVSAPPTWLNSLMEVDPTPAWILLAPGVWMLLTLALIVETILRFTVFGRHAYAIGSNENASRLCGIPVTRRRLSIYALGGAFAGMAGVLQFSNLTVGDPTAAEGMELDIIAAVVIGGGSLQGGQGRAVGSLIGALFMAVLRNGCNMTGIPNYLQNIAVGSIIIGAMGLERLHLRLRD